jgi:predicted nicotinamide N-methyase
MADLENPLYCNRYEIAVTDEVVTIRFYYRDPFKQPPDDLILLSSVAFDKTLCNVFVANLLAKLKEGESPPQSRSRF